MKAGDPVITPAGEGVVFTVRTRYVWTGFHSRAQAYVAVKFGPGDVKVFPAQQVKPKLEVV